MNGCKILEVDRSTISKVGYNATMGEAEAICLVKRMTSVPVPRVLIAYTIDDIGFILMEKVLGSTLESDLEHLSSDSLKDLAGQPREYIHQWRKIEGSFLGGVDGSTLCGRHIQNIHGKIYRVSMGLSQHETNSMKASLMHYAILDQAESSTRGITPLRTGSDHLERNAAVEKES
ncbi:hypothetical protein PV04_00892 [Phialophora macrospora]|uniref:Aminoglycoside phosphotransferase domain-containing protein n=1 Tax=Phialophora macrospora TaxID=1851006 RepID=A0A0D2D542_9EURO|nr:hypothetical protein PV04_00892 [Phialophora macrospora]